MNAITLRELLERDINTLTLLLDQRAKLADEMFRARDLALATALSALDHRLEIMNEFRASLEDQRASFLPRAEYNVQHEALEDEVHRSIQEHKNFAKSADVDKLDSRGNERYAEVLKQIQNFREQTAASIADLRETRSRELGKEKGVTSVWAAAAVVAGLIIALLGIGAGVLIRLPPTITH